MTFSPNRESCPHLISIFWMVTLNSVDIGQALTLVYRFSRFIVRRWGSSMMTSRFHKNWTHLPEIRKATLGISCCCNIKVDQCDPEILLRKATKRGITSFPPTWQPKPPQVGGLHHRASIQIHFGGDRYSTENIYGFQENWHLFSIKRRSLRPTPLTPEGWRKHNAKPELLVASEVWQRYSNPLDSLDQEYDSDHHSQIQPEKP